MHSSGIGRDFFPAYISFPLPARDPRSVLKVASVSEPDEPLKPHDPGAVVGSEDSHVGDGVDDGHEVGEDLLVEVVLPARDAPHETARQIHDHVTNH